MQAPIWIVAYLGMYHFTIQMTNSEVNLTFVRLMSVFSVGSMAASFYVFLYYFAPQYFWTARYGLFLLYGGLWSLIVFPVINWLSIEMISSVYSTLINDFFSNWLSSFIGASFFGALGALYSMPAFVRMKEKKELENRNLKSRFEALTSKLNPHLLFNTLNNIDALIEDDPGQASELLTKLADLLRYTIYHTGEDSVLLVDEMRVLEAYIALEKIRVTNPGRVEVTVNIYDENISVPPMIFLPFVENAFKHGDLTQDGAKLEIVIFGDQRQVTFKCINTMLEKTHKINRKGMGFELIIGRLKVLFPDKHKLVVHERGKEFNVLLKLDLI